MSKLIAIEGLDGAGKSTQIELLLRYLEQKKVKTQFVHFPRTAYPNMYGDMIAKFLRGEYGKLEDVHPQLVALLFAQDRHDFSTTMKSWLAAGDYVVMDRYVLSNIAFQCAKLVQPKEQEALSQWILDFEFEYNKIPIPDLSIYLDVPFSFVERALTTTRKGEERAYLLGKTDIHEASLSFQKNVKQQYERMLLHNEQFQRINCANSQQEMKSPLEIHAQIVTLLER
jgi:dTMP kinase